MGGQKKRLPFFRDFIKERLRHPVESEAEQKMNSPRTPLISLGLLAFVATAMPAHHDSPSLW